MRDDGINKTGICKYYDMTHDSFRFKKKSFLLLSENKILS